VAALAAVDRALDRTPLFALRGELPVDMDEQRVQCHVCGGWYRALAPTHLSRAHGVTADEYRELVGLRPRHPLWAPDLIEAQGARLRSRIAAEPRLRAAMAKGRALAQRGELQRRARSRLAKRRVSLERERELVKRGSRLGRSRAAGFRRSRERETPRGPLTRGQIAFLSRMGTLGWQYSGKPCVGWVRSTPPTDRTRMTSDDRPRRADT
jgi:hypothetical protein